MFEHRPSRLLAVGLGAAVMTGGMLAVAPVATASPDAPTTSAAATAPLEAVTRTEVIERAQTWLDPQVPYSMELIHESGYRQDCSGYVAMAWGTPAPGDSTVTLPNYATKISADELAKGDVLMKGGPGTGGANGHVAIFEEWANDERTAYIGYEQSGSAGGTVHREIPYPYFDGGAGFEPYRYNEITDG